MHAESPSLSEPGRAARGGGPGTRQTWRQKSGKRKASLLDGGTRTRKGNEDRDTYTCYFCTQHMLYTSILTNQVRHCSEMEHRYRCWFILPSFFPMFFFTERMPIIQPTRSSFKSDVSRGGSGCSRSFSYDSKPAS